jgi:carboxylesterase
VTDELAWFAGSEHQSFAFSDDVGRDGALLLHGFPGTPAELRPLSEALSSAGVATRAPLLPGLGPEMDQLGEVGARDWLASAAQVWTSVRSTHTRPVLVGYSMGGALALRLAAAHPPHRLVLVAPLWRMLGPAWPLGSLLPVVERVVPSFGLLDHGSALDNLEVREFLARAAPEADLDDPEVRTELRRRVRLRTTIIAQLWQLAIGSGGAARAVRVPTLILQGKTDRVVRPRDTRELARRFGGPVQLHELEGGHLLLDSGASTWSIVRDLIVGFVMA